MRRFLFPLLSALCVVLALSACGKKGPLYLPDPNAKPDKNKPAQ